MEYLDISLYEEDRTFNYLGVFSCFLIIFVLCFFLFTKFLKYEEGFKVYGLVLNDSSFQVVIPSQMEDELRRSFCVRTLGQTNMILSLELIKTDFESGIYYRTMNVNISKNEKLVPGEIYEFNLIYRSTTWWNVLIEYGKGVVI